MVTTSLSKTVKLWELNTGTRFASDNSDRFWNPINPITCAAFSVDSYRLVTCSAASRGIKIWDTITGKCQRVLAGVKSSISSLVFSPDGLQLALGPYYDYGRVNLWNVETGTCQYTFEEEGKIVDLVHSADGTLLVLALQSREIIVWDVKKALSQVRLHGSCSSTTSLAFSPNGLHFAALNKVTLLLRDLSTGERLITDGNLGSFVNNANIALLFAKESRRLALVSEDGFVRAEATARGAVWMIDHAPLSSLDEHSPYLSGNQQVSSAYRVKGETFHIDTGHNGNVNTESRAFPQLPRFCIDGPWIKSGYERVLWLPKEYRTNVFAATGNMIALGCESGSVLIIRFADNKSFYRGRPIKQPGICFRKMVT